MEEMSLAAGLDRVKFQCKRIGPIHSLYEKHPEMKHYVDTLETGMADALTAMEEVGATPVLPDGKVGGNAAVRFTAGDDQYLLVTKSGKQAKQRMVCNDFCVITSFDETRWSCEYLSCSESVVPTSDTPLHNLVLNSCTKLAWTEEPWVALHGHALETEEKAKRFGLPISREETLFSTPEDSKALYELMKEYPYPEHKVFIRKGHGFFIIGSSLTDAFKTFNQSIKSAILQLDEFKFEG